MSDPASHDDASVAPDVLREVESGRTVEVVRSGEVVALVVPPDMARRTTTRPAIERAGFSGLLRVEVDIDTQSILDELRADW